MILIEGLQFVDQWEINGFIDESNATVSNVTYRHHIKK